MSSTDLQTKPESSVRQGRQGLAQRLARVLHTILPHAGRSAEDMAAQDSVDVAGHAATSGSATAYQRLASRMSAAVFQLAPDGAILFVDQTITAITGYGPEELLGGNWWDILFPGEQAKQIPELLKRLRCGDVTGYDLVLTHKTGMLVTLGLNSANYYDPDGTLQTIVGWVVDRTQHRRAEAKARAVVETLSERIKELTVLHGTMRILQSEDKPVPDVLREVVDILPRAWRYPDVAAARIVWDDQVYATPNFSSTPWMQRAKLSTTDGKRGTLEVCYQQYSSEIAEPPFIAEELALLNSLAEMLRSFLQRRQATEALRRTRDELEKSVQERTTELAQTNEELRTERDMLQTIMDHTDTQLAYLDSQFNFLRVNSAYVQGCGHSRDELLGRNHFYFFPNAENQAIFERVRDTGQPIEFRAKPFQFADQPERGTTYWDWTLTPVLDEAGQTQSLVFSLMDVTERENVLARLRHSEAQAHARADELAALMDAMPVYTMIAQDAECRNIVGNQEACRLMGLPPGANVSMNVEGQMVSGTNTFQNGRELTAPEMPMQQVTRTGQPLRDWEMTMIGQDGATRDVLGNVVPLFDEASQVRGAIGAFLDITELKRAHAALAESEARMRAMLEHLPVGVWFADGRGQITYGNEVGQRIWAGAHYVGLDQFTEYKAWWRDTGQPLAPEDWAVARAVRTGQSSLDELLEIECFDGTHKVIRNSAVAILGPAGEVTGVVVLNEDVTEGTRREEAYRETLERLRLATTAAGMGIFEWDVAADQALWENERMYEIFGRRREEGAATKAEFVTQLLHPDDVDGFERDLAESMQPDRFFISTCRIHRGDEPAWRWIEFLGRFALAPDGRPVRLVGTVTDITDRKQALESLRESEAQLSFALDVSQMGHWELDLLDHTARRSLRHDQIFGYSEALPNWTYEMFLEHVAPQDREQVDEAFRIAIEQGRDWDFECRITRQDGALRWIWACGRLRHDESGQPRKLVGIVLDITARKQAEEERERLLVENRSHREFLEQLMHALPVGIAVVGGPEYCFEFANPYYETIVARAEGGQTAFEASNLALTGLPFADVVPSMAAQAVTNLLETARRTGNTASVRELGVTMAPGREEMYWNMDHVPLHDGGRVDRILILVNEVTAEVRARKQIEQLAARDEAILNNMTEGVMIADEQGNVLGINPAARRIHNHADDENVDRPMATFVPSFELRTPDGVALPIDQWPLPRVLRGETFAAYELVVQRTEDGQVRHVSYGGAPVQDENGKIVLGIVTSRDITAQKEAERDRERLMRELHAQNVQLQHLMQELEQERGRLYEALNASRRREAEVSALLAISHDVASELELEPLLDVILDQLQGMIECTGYAIYLLNEDTLAAMDYHGPLLRDEAMGLSFSWQGAIGVQEVVQGREPVIIDDVRGDSVLGQAWQERALPEQRKLLGDSRSWMGVPLVTKNQVIGLFRLDHLEPGHFGPHHARLAMAMADQAAVAVENARLYGRAQQVATIEERQRIARELHDSVSQVLYSIVLGARTARMMIDRDPAKAIEPIDYVFSLAEAGLAEMRAMIFELRPDALQSEGLVLALQRRVDVLRSRYGLQVVAEFGEEPECSVEIKEAIYRIAQEAMHNATRHARATQVEIKMSFSPTTLCLLVADNGVGFDPSASHPGRMGLRSMRERIIRLGGTLDIASTPGQGTSVRAEIPV